MDPVTMLLWQVRWSSTWTTQKSSSRMSSHSFKQTILRGGFLVLGAPNHCMMNLLRKCSQLLKPGGSIFVTTINRLVKDLKEQVVKAISSSKPPRSTRSWLLAILGAEYVLGLLPRGTHEVCDWSTLVSLKKLSCSFLIVFSSGRSLSSLRSWGGCWKVESALWGESLSDFIVQFKISDFIVRLKIHIWFHSSV